MARPSTSWKQRSRRPTQPRDMPSPQGTGERDQGHRRRRLLQRHRRRRVPPPPRTPPADRGCGGRAGKLVNEMLKFLYEGEDDYVEIDPVAYAPALGSGRDECLPEAVRRHRNESRHTRIPKTTGGPRSIPRLVHAGLERPASRGVRSRQRCDHPHPCKRPQGRRLVRGHAEAFEENRIAVTRTIDSPGANSDSLVIQDRPGVRRALTALQPRRARDRHLLGRLPEVRLR